MHLRDMPIRRKLMVSILGTSCAVLFLTLASFFAYELLTFRQSSITQLSTLGKVIANNSTAALAFDNQDDALEVLNALKAEPHITAAALYDKDGNLFTKFSPADTIISVPDHPENDSYHFTASHLIGFQPVMQDDKRLGTLYLQSNMEAMYDRLKLYALIAAVVAAGSLLLAYILSRILQQQVAEPILVLSKTARTVSEDRNYSVRAPKLGKDEVGLLTNTFNQMLNKIQEDDEETRRAATKLQNQLSRHDLLNRITRSIGERLDLPSIFQVIIRSLEDSMPIDFGTMCLYDPMEETLTVCNIGTAGQEFATRIGISEKGRLPIDQNGLSRCIRGYLVYEPDTSQIYFPFPQQLAKGGLFSLVAAPLLIESKVFGILIAARKEVNAFTSDDCEFLRQLSEHTALATHQTKLYTELQQAYDDLRMSQRTVMQQERLRALGEMASGISHDINNAISPAALYAESLLEQESGLTGEAREYLETIQRAIADVAQTMSRMREFYRQREPQMALEPIDLNKLVKQAVDLSRARWRDLSLESGVVIDVHPELAENLPLIMGAEVEIRDALINLIFNGVDAMTAGGGGKLTIRTNPLQNYQNNGNGNSDNRFVQIEVTDTGTGMDEETRRRCLEPFYTTKGERGTGLGLAMVYGMIQRHGAEIDIDSKVGTGTTMRMLFPAATITETATRNNELPVRPSFKLNLLVVDDDPMLIKSLRDILEKDGHAVTTADGGANGIEKFTESIQTHKYFDAVITDLGMPHVDGRKVAAAVKNASPDTPVILLTGWGQRMMAEQEIPPNVDRLLAKPPRIHDLRSALASVTSERTSPHPS